MYSRLFLFVAALAFFTTSTASAGFIPRPSFAASLISLAAAGDSESIVTMPEVAVGDKIPSVDLMELKESGDKPETVNLADLIAGKRVAIFGVPGAFTPGCSKSHLPSFMEAQGDLKAKGVDLTICVATNDAFVMEVGRDLCCMILFVHFLFLPFQFLNTPRAYS